MSSLFKKPPKPDKPPPVPNQSDAEVQANADEQRRRIAAQTKASSWLTGGQGVARDASAYAGSKLLGGG